MKITRRSMMSGVIRTLDLPVTEDQIACWENGMTIQRAMPNLTDSQREFILTGITDDEWDEAFPEEDDEYFSD